MKAEEYISSGVLELYVMGSLSATEEKEVEEMVAKHPEVAGELRKIEDAMEQYAFSHAKDAPVSAKEGLFSQIDAREKKIPQLAVSKNEAPTVSASSKWLMAASVSIAVFASALAFKFWLDLNEVKQELAIVQQSNQELALNIQRTNNELKDSESYLDFIKNNDTKYVELKGLEISPESGAVVYWNEGSGEVLLTVRGLPAPPAGMQYQLWGLKDGLPIDAGVFDTTGDLQAMKTISAADAFAVTLEKAGGSPTPNLEALYMMGKLTS